MSRINLSFARIARLSVLACGLVLHAQDAGMVLRTSVTYNTQRATLPLTDEQRKQAEELGREAQQAGRAGNFGDAMRLYRHGMAIMRGTPWTPEYELAASLQGRLDHAMVEPGNRVTVTLAPLYASTRPVEKKITASVVFLSAQRNGTPEKSLTSGVAVNPAALPFTAQVAVPDAAPGDYALEVRFAMDGAAPVPAARLPLHVEPLSTIVQRLRDRLAKFPKRDNPTLPSAEYALVLYDRADRGDTNPAEYRFRDEFAAANGILDAIEAGRDPFAGKHGDFRKAYRSAVDNTLQPYRLLVPASYNGTRPAPLLVALHGMGGDENSMFDSYRETLKREAERAGFITVCPKGRDTASMYRGPAEQDVMDVIAEVRRDYRIDPHRIFLMGHSMGGYGTWSIAMAHPDVFAALGPIAGGGNPAGMATIRNVPQYVVHGDNDKTVPVTQSRMMVEAGKKAGAKIVYVEVPGGSHVDVAAPQFGPMLDFFATVGR
jgi:acetyl esterase/lipase